MCVYPLGIDYVQWGKYRVRHFQKYTTKATESYGFSYPRINKGWSWCEFRKTINQPEELRQ